MADKKKQNVRYVTPVGVASWPKLHEPDEKYNTFQVKLLLDPNTKPHADFMAKLDTMTDAAVEEMKKEHSKYAKQIKRAAPYAPELDKEGDETGLIVVNFSAPSVFVRKKDKKEFPNKIALYDAAGTPLASDVRVGGGSQIQVSFESWPYFIPKDKDAGMTRRLVAARVVELKVWSGNQTASDFGFDVNDAFAESVASGADADDSDEDDF